MKECGMSRNMLGIGDLKKGERIYVICIKYASVEDLKAFSFLCIDCIDITNKKMTIVTHKF
jgi:hypothetical protein